MFQQVDCDGDGKITWDEFSTFVLNRSIDAYRFRDGVRERILQDALSDDPYNTPACYHRDMINSVACIPRIGKYVTCGRDGTLRLWSAHTRRHQHTIDVATSSPQAWVTACVDVLQAPPEGAASMLAVCCTDRTLSLYETARFRLAARYSLGDVVPFCCDSFSHLTASRDSAIDRLVVGDDRGRLHFFAVTAAFLRPAAGAPPPQPVGVLPAHGGTVTACRYVRLSSKGLVISSSADGTLALVDVADLSAVRHYRGHERYHSPGYLVPLSAECAVLCFAVCPEPIGYVVSGGQDHAAQVLYSPFSTRSSSYFLGCNDNHLL